FRCSISECASFIKSQRLQAASFFEMDATFNEYSVTCCITNSCYNRNRCRNDQPTRTTYNKCGKPKVCPIGPGSSHNEWRKNRSDEHTSELQSRFELVCRLLLG